MHLRFKLSFFS